MQEDFTQHPAGVPPRSYTQWEYHFARGERLDGSRADPKGLFIGADSPQALDANLAQLCCERVLDLPEKDAQEQEVQTTAVLRWFTQHDDWLLILDNVDMPGAAQAVTQLLPQLHSGRVLITSRLSDWGDGVQSLPLDTLVEASNAMKRRSGAGSKG